MKVDFRKLTMLTIKEYVQKTKEEMKEEISKLKRVPSFTIIQVNEDAGSNAYVKGKLKDAQELGVDAKLLKLPLDTSEEELLKLIDELNKDDSCDGFIVTIKQSCKINAIAANRHP